MANRKKTKSKIIEIGDIDEFKPVNTYRLYYDDHGFHIDFGFWKGENEVEVVAQNVLADDKIANFLREAVVKALKYDREYNRDIFPEELKAAILDKDSKESD